MGVCDSLRVGVCVQASRRRQLGPRSHGGGQGARFPHPAAVVGVPRQHAGAVQRDDRPGARR